ncbi:MAG TPA: hypothetical protein VFH67_05680, partial [bacterium]|nr:hypothetical protein [bacterium]
TTGASATFPLFIKMDYRKATGAVTVRGTTAPGTVVQVPGATAVVKQSGTYALKTSLPVNLVAVKGTQIRRFRFDLPPKAKPHLSYLLVNADLSKMRSSVTGQLTMTEHPAAKVFVEHVEKGSKHQAAIIKGRFSLGGLPLVKGKNTLRWSLQLGFIHSPGPDITFTTE